jgi:hypothetical protein
VDGKLWVEPVGELIIARVRGEPTAALLRQCHEQVVALAVEARRHRVLLDVLEMEAPPVDVPLEQWKLDKELGDLKLRRAISSPTRALPTSPGSPSATGSIGSSTTIWSLPSAGSPRPASSVAATTRQLRALTAAT